MRNDKLTGKTLAELLDDPDKTVSDLAIAILRRLRQLLLGKK